MKDIYVIGCSGFGREVDHLIYAINQIAPTWRLAGFADDAPSEENVALATSLGVPVIGDVSRLLELQPSHYVIGIGTGRIRHEIDARMSSAGWTPAVLVHPEASIGRDVELGPGTIICAGVRATTNIQLGRHVHLNLNTTVGHDTQLADYVTLNPLVAISGGVTLGTCATVGTHAAVLQYLDVGADSMIGAGSVVVKPVAPGLTVKGVPAR